MAPTLALIACFFIALSSAYAVENGVRAMNRENKTVCDEIAYVTTIRTSEYFTDKMTMRAGISSYRVFRDNSLFSRDLVVAVVIDSRISRQHKSFLLADLRSYETRFVIYPGITEDGHLDAVPDYVYGLRAFRSTNDSTACRVLYVSPNSLFLKDPTEFLVSNSDGNISSESGVHCLCQRNEFKNSVVENFLSNVGLSAEQRAMATQAKGPNHYPIFCSPDLIFFSNLDETQRLLDISDSMSSDYIYKSQFSPAVFGAEISPPPPRHEFESVLLHVTLLIMVSKPSLIGVVGQLPTFIGTDLGSASGTNLSSADAEPSDLYILLYPVLPGSGQRATFHFAPPDEKQPLCSVDVSQWGMLTLSLNAPKYLSVAKAATNIIRDTPYACEVLANSMSAVPFADFLEFGSQSVSAVSKPWHFGLSLSRESKKNSADNSYYQGLSLLTDAFGSRSASVVHITSNRCDGSSEKCPDVVSSEDLLNDLVVFYESMPPTQLHVIQRKLPCVVWAESINCSGVIGSLESRLYRIGDIPATHMCSSHPVLLF